MDGWMIDRQKDGWMDRQMIDRQKDGSIEGWMDG